MNRTIVVTGSASGMGAATAERLRSQGHRVIGVDLRDADVVADLATLAGRSSMVADVAALAPTGIDSVVASAGIAAAPDPGLILAVNYFGAVATMEGLRPLLAKSNAPRAVAIASTAALLPYEEDVVGACLDGNEVRARQLCGDSGVGYTASKQAISQWVRKTAIDQEWAGSGISLNAIGPGTVRTPMTAPLMADEEMRKLLVESTPIAVADYADPEDLAEPIAFLATMETGYMVGQIVFVDGGTDVLLRPGTL